MPKGKGYEGQPRTGFLHETSTNPTKKGSDVDLTGPQKTRGYRQPGTGGGGIPRGGGKDVPLETQGKTGYGVQEAGATKDSGGHGMTDISADQIKPV